MYIEREDFYKLLLDHVESGEALYTSLLMNMIDNPQRYSGIFRLSTIKSKIIQNISQSREIKFGYFFEDLVTAYIEKLGYTNLDKRLTGIESGDLDNDLDVDQLFYKGDTLYLVEMKIRDDHDSTKKVGQYQNFQKKIEIIKEQYKDKKIVAIIRFVDADFKKNKNYYSQKIEQENVQNVEFHLYYGDEFFNSLEKGKDAWSEIITHLNNYHQSDLALTDIEIPNFDKDPRIEKALLKLPTKYWKKLISKDEKYIILRNSLFSSKGNLDKVYKIRGNK